MTGAFLWREGEVIHWFGALGVAGTWGQMIIYHRQSADSGATWSDARIIIPDHANGQAQVGNVPFWCTDGVVIVPGDDNAVNGSRLYASRDNGETWEIRLGRALGIHAAMTENQQGEIIAFGRVFRPEADRLPMSVSIDGGNTFRSRFTDLPGIRSGQRLCLLWLDEATLALFSFADGRTFGEGESALSGNGLYGAVSYDGGHSWPLRRLITYGKRREIDGGAWTGKFVMDESHAEPKGYLSATLGADGTIHLISSRLHYRFNRTWLVGEDDAI